MVISWCKFLWLRRFRNLIDVFRTGLLTFEYGSVDVFFISIVVGNLFLVSAQVWALLLWHR